MMKKLLALMLAAAAVLALVSCGSAAPAEPPAETPTDKPVEAPVETPQPDYPDMPASVETPGPGPVDPGSGYGLFLKLLPGMTRAEADAILGKPAAEDEDRLYYPVTMNGAETDILVTLDGSGKIAAISGGFINSRCRPALADGAVDLTGASGLDDGSIDTYDKCAAAFKSPGSLIAIDGDGGKSYVWVEEGGEFMRVTFRSDGTVKSYSGIC